MKKLAFLLALYISLQPAVPVIDFVVNYGYIITELCVNRDKPEVECNGTCYLKQELAQASEKENPISQDRKIPLPAYELFFQEADLVTSGFIETPVKTVPGCPVEVFVHQEIQDIFRPPIFIS